MFSQFKLNEIMFSNIFFWLFGIYRFVILGGWHSCLGKYSVGTVIQEILMFIYLFLATLGLCFCARAFSRDLRHVEFFWTRDGTSVPCIGRWILYHSPPGKSIMFIKEKFGLRNSALYCLFLVFQHPISHSSDGEFLLYKSPVPEAESFDSDLCNAQSLLFFP